MKKLNISNKKKIILLIALLVIIVVSLLIVILLTNKEDKDTIKIVNSKEVENLYQTSNNKCTDTTDEKDSLILYLIFSKLDKDKKLTDNISYDEYENTAKTILKIDDIPAVINNYLYDGYSYTLDNDKITREKSECKEKYVSKIYGYSNNNNTLDLYISSGYVKDGKVYNFDNIEIGDYSKKTINKVLDSGTIKIYHYKKENDNYILDSISSD